ASVVEFDASTYAVWQAGTRFEPFFESLAARTVVFDLPYCDLARAPSTRGVVAWGAHDPGTPTATNPPELATELLEAIGPYPAQPATYAMRWRSATATTAMGAELVRGIDARSEAARWLLTDRLEAWDLAIVVSGELHSAAEGLWHGVDPTHPLHGHESAAAA